MSRAPAAVRRLVVAVDLAGSTAQDHLRQIATQRRLADVLEVACAEAGIDRPACLRQPQGDGELLLLPPGIDEGRVVPDLVRELGIALREVNRDLSDAARLRLRAALHQGVVHEAAGGFVGRAVVRAFRLLDSAELRAVLREQPRCELALIVSGQLFEDVVEHGYRGLDPQAFRQVRVEVPEKGFAGDGWVHVVLAPPAVPPAAPPAGPAGAGRGGGPRPVAPADLPPVPRPEEVAPRLFRPEVFRQFEGN
ncbi:hypothetical protein GCM10018781_65580 [Kitasatospora indigofera]|uniref:Uncharacterized protein n=1 Tax=Kitasatospora indigofera TaxID=67307 RepID=A0A919GDC7_9ACTN|nr:hypothetical protein [Kitasatospora indigofera]GHH81930.1 hypothetical protein GCM10018781_65580 [Kitasatospora indigofera]